MTENVVGLLVLLAMAVGIPGVIIGLSALAGPRGKKVTDLTPYECGVKPFESARKRFSVKFYLVGMLFILFDIETVFIYPWAVELRARAGTEAGMFVFWVMMVFLFILTLGFAYEWGRGALKWDR